MTLAEEFAHVILHREIIENVQTPDDFKMIQKHPDWATCDRNAKRLAASLLMPVRHVSNIGREWYQKSIPKVGFRNPPALKDFIANKMADEFLVSRQTMSIRLNEWPIKLYDKIDEAMKNRFDFLQ